MRDSDIADAARVMYLARIWAEGIPDDLERALVVRLIDDFPYVWDDLAASWDATRGKGLQWDALSNEKRARYFLLHCRRYASDAIRSIFENGDFSDFMPDASEIQSAPELDECTNGARCEWGA